MDKNVSFSTLFKAEYYKTKRNLGRWILLLFPLIITLCVDIYIFIHTERIENNRGYNPWIYLLGRYIFPIYSFLYPIITAVFCFSFCDMEYKNNSFKDLFTLPATKTKIFFAKILYLLENLFVSLLLAYCLFLISGLLMRFVFPDWGFQDYDVQLITLVSFTKMFLGLIAVCFIQFSLSLLFKHFVVPICFVCAAQMFSIVFYRWEYIDFIPYNEGYVVYYDYIQEVVDFFERTDWINCIYCAVFLFFSYFIFQRMKV